MEPMIYFAMCFHVHILFSCAHPHSYHSIPLQVTFGEGPLGLTFSKEAVDGSGMAFVVHDVTGQGMELGILQGDIILSVGAQKLDGSEKEEDVVLQIQSSQRPLEMTFSSNIDTSLDPDSDAGSESRSQTK